MTFSIAARDPQNGWLGVATSSKAIAAGGMVPYVKAGVGAIASQSFVNPYLGIDGLQLLGDGLPAARVLERVIEGDPGRDLRQLAIVDRDGRVASFTGDRCIPWAGQIMGGGYVCLGNILRGEQVVKAMADTFERGAGEPLYERLMRVLEAGQEAGGDRRGRQSAGMYIMGEQEYPLCDIRVDDHEDPVPELRRVLAVWEKEELPFLAVSPRRDDYIPHWEQVMHVRNQIEQELDEQQAVTTAKES
jgi:uncharacterized Ntn-hydrolase superfamily protein